MNLIFVGDLHRKWKYFSNLLTGLPENSTFIQCGDFGIGFARLEDDQRDLGDLSDSLKRINSKMLVIRGNHDIPSLFNGFEISENITLLKDYSIMELGDKKILFIGGATSIDRKARVTGRNYWKNEKPEYRPEELEKMEDIDIVVSHTGPEPIRPVGMGNLMYWFDKDPDLYRELLEENEKFDTIDKILLNRPKYWFCGHFHPNSKRMFENDTNYIQLNELEMYQI